MTSFPLSVLAATFLLACTLDGAVAHAASEASDTADDPAYDDGWQHADDGGSGWGSIWNFNSGSNTGAIIGSSPAIDTAGRSFGLYNEADGSAIVVSRLFDGPLEVGQTFGVDVARDPGGGEPAVWLVAGGNARLRFSYSEFWGQYRVQDADGFYGIGPSEPIQAVRVDIARSARTSTA